MSDFDELFYVKFRIILSLLHSGMSSMHTKSVKIIILLKTILANKPSRSNISHRTPHEIASVVNLENH